jgi:hypothetical protein
MFGVIRCNFSCAEQDSSRLQNRIFSQNRLLHSAQRKRREILTKVSIFELLNRPGSSAGSTKRYASRSQLSGLLRSVNAAKTKSGSVQTRVTLFPAEKYAVGRRAPSHTSSYCCSRFEIKQVLGGPLEAGASTEARRLQWQHLKFSFYSTSPLLLFFTS